MKLNIILQGDALQVLRTLPNESIDCVMTSPPYWALRDYGVKDQLGLEPTFQKYIDKLCNIFDEVKRVLKKSGTCWVNIGDTYGGSGGDSGKKIGRERRGSHGIDTRPVGISGLKGNQQATKGLEKSLVQIPSRFSIEMCNRGWILRNTIIWYKPNCMPSSAKDRFTVDFEYLFFFVKNKKYWFEQQLEKSTYSDDRLGKGRLEYGGKRNTAVVVSDNRNKRTVWKITTKGYKEAHFAVYPEKLCETPIKAGCPEFICKKCGKGKEKIVEREIAPKEVFTKKNTSEESFTGSYVEGEMRGQGQKLQDWRNKHPDKFKGYTNCNCNAGFEGGIVLDPFAGACTTGVVAKKLNRNYIMIEINPEYVKMGEKRLSNTQSPLL